MYRRALFVKPGASGDRLQITPVLRAFHTHFRSAEITMLVGSPETASLFAHHPLVVETIVFDRRGEHKSLKALAQLWSRIRKNRFDLVLHYQRSNLKAWFLASAAMPCHISVYHKSRTRGIHAVTNHLEPLRRL